MVFANMATGFICSYLTCAHEGRDMSMVPITLHRPLDSLGLQKPLHVHLKALALCSSFYSCLARTWESWQGSLNKMSHNYP
jgi:hypothetical protein